MAEDESSTTSEESLDATSERFDPLKALYSSKMLISLPDAPVYDNVSKFESVLSGTCSKKDPSKGEKEARAAKGAAITVRGTGRIARVWDPSRKNVLSKMQKLFGPLGLLYTYMQCRTRVKVYTRNARGIRGHVEAYVAAFDKHWNLALEDCFEVWSRRIKRKAPALGVSDRKVYVADEDVPKIVVRKSEGKMETLERHVPQMLLRGEQVAIIVKIN